MIHWPGNLASVSMHSSSDSNTNKNCSMNMANIFEFLSKDGNITPEKARKSRQMQFRDKTAYVWGLRYRWDPSLSRIPDPRIPHFMPPWSHVISVIILFLQDTAWVSTNKGSINRLLHLLLLFFIYIKPLKFNFTMENMCPESNFNFSYSHWAQSMLTNDWPTNRLILEQVWLD